MTYDAAAGQATLYRHVDVRLQYESPRTLALTLFEPAQTHTVPGEPLGVTAHLVNAGDEPKMVT